jgi:hypothetical protein
MPIGAMHNFCLALSTLGLLCSSTMSAQSSSEADFAPFLKQHCVTCHSDKLKTADLSLQNREPNHPASAPDIWEKVIRKLRVGMMPPQGAPQPNPAARARLVSSLEAAFDRAAAQRPDPGRSPVHRLNRTEYANAIRDLLALEVDVTSLLPPDDSGLRLRQQRRFIGSLARPARTLCRRGGCGANSGRRRDWLGFPF